MDKIIKILTQFFQIIVRPIGRLNKDSDPRVIANGDFTDSLNCRAVTNLGQTTNSREIILGNELVFELEDIVLQNRIFRIFIDKTVSYNAIISFYTPNFQIGTFTTLGIVSGDNIALNLSNNLAAITIFLTGEGQTYNASSTITSTTTGYIDVEITTVNYWDYDIKNNPAISVANKADVPTAIIQEAVDQSLIGEWNLIGSYDLEGELKTWWTTQKNLPEVLDITNVANNGGIFEITVSAPTNIATNSKVVLLGTTVADGEWIVAATSTTSFTLYGSTYAAGWVSGGTATINPNGNGELGHAVKNEQTGNWTYIRLIRSQKFNWVTKHQIDTYCDKGFLGKRYIYTDDYNRPALLYDYTQVYVNDCLLNFVDPLNIYAYSDLETEIILQLNTADFTFGFTGQTQTGGNILSGNSRYAVRLLTETFAATDWTFLDNPIPATVESEFGAGKIFFGRPAGTPTPKINNFLVQGNILGLFKYIELAVVNYQGTATSGWIVRRDLITGNSMTLQHTGFEQSTQDLDIGTLNSFTKTISTAKNIDSLDGYLLLSNITTSSILNLTTFFENMTYEIHRTTLLGTSAGVFSVGSFINNNLSVGEYMLSDNVYSRVGYMLNERYRFAGIAEFTDGSESNAFFIRDIIINTDNTQPGCNAALPDFDFTVNPTGTQLPYSFYIKFDTPNFNTIINGVRVGDVVKRIRIMRCEVTNPQVLATGIGLPSVSDHAGGIVAGYFSWVDPANTATRDQYGEWPFPAGVDEAAQLPTLPIDYAFGDATAPNNFLYHRDYISLYFPDVFMGHTQIIPTLNDTIINFGMPTANRQTYLGVATAFVNDYYLEMNGETGAPVYINVDEGANISKGGSATINTLLYSKRAVAGNSDFEAPAGIVVYSSTDTLDPITANPDWAIYNVQYFRAIADGDTQYGSKVNSRYVWTGTTFDADSTATQFDVFGGDVFTQKNYLKDRYPMLVSRAFGQGFSFYSQNRVNFQMRNPNAGTGTPTAFPASNGATNSLQINTWLDNPDIESLSYNEGYTIRNQVTSYAAFDPTARLSNDEPVSIYYSGKLVGGSSVDDNRKFLPLNRTVLEYQYGEINDTIIANGEMYSLQPRKFERLNFIANELLRTTSGVEIVLGDGSAFSRRPIQLSEYGTNSKWSVRAGRGAQGNDTIYWLSEYGRNVMRFGYDGSQNISLIHNMDSFFANNLNMVVGKDTPADDQGIHAVWNERFKEYILTVRAWRDHVNPFDIGTTYEIGDVVEYGIQQFEEIPAFYISLTNGNIGNIPNLSTTDWELISITNNQYYNFYTYVVSEIKNGFDGRLTPKPRIYAEFNNTYLTPRKVSNTGQMYEANRGDYAIWDDDDSTQQAENGLVRNVMNADADSTKQYSAVRVRTEIVPFRMNFATTSQVSYLDAADFIKREDKFDAAIQNDSTLTLTGNAYGAEANPLGLNNLDTGNLWGDFLEVELVFEYGNYQRYYSTIVRGQLSDRKNKS